MNRRVMLALLLGAGCRMAQAEGETWESALALYRGRQYAAARALFETVASAEPTDRRANFYLGRIALWFNHEDAAATYLEAAAAAAPRDAAVQNALGDLYGLRAQSAPLLTKPHWACKCRTAYEAAIALDPREVRYHWSLLGYCLMAPRVVGGGLDRARAEAATLARLDEMQGRIARATIALHTHEAAVAFGEFDAVLRVRPDDYLALYHVGRCAAVSGEQLERGLAALRRCLISGVPHEPEMPTLANVHQRLGDILARIGDDGSARAEYATVRKLEPDFRPQKVMLRY